MERIDRLSSGGKKFDVEAWFHQAAATAIISRYRPISMEKIADDSVARKTPLDLYLHIPFCRRLCDYCAYERIPANFSTREQFVANLVDYLPRVLPFYSKDRPLQSLAIGGGTPSVLTSSQINRLINTIDSVVDLSSTTITLELHPHDVSETYLAELIKAGVNRFSVGIQNFNADQKINMGRSAKKQQEADYSTPPAESLEEVRCLDILNSTGVNYNLDLIYGTNGQTIGDWYENLEYTVDRFRPPMITTYPYIRAYGSKAYNLPQNRAGIWDRRKMQHLAKKYLTEKGYDQTNPVTYAQDNLYQSSPYTKSSEWNFLGIGPRAYSRIITDNGVWYFIDPEGTNNFIDNSDHIYYGSRLPKILDKVIIELMLSTSGFAYDRGEIPLLACHPEVFVLTSAILYAVLNSPKLDQLSPKIH